MTVTRLADGTCSRCGQIMRETQIAPEFTVWQCRFNAHSVREGAAPPEPKESDLHLPVKRSARVMIDKPEYLCSIDYCRKFRDGDTRLCARHRERNKIASRRFYARQRAMA